MGQWLEEGEILKIKGFFSLICLLDDSDSSVKNKLQSFNSSREINQEALELQLILEQHEG